MFVSPCHLQGGALGVWASQALGYTSCTEVVPWRCHRSMVADALVAKKVPVKHIMSKTVAKPHGLSYMAVRKNGKLGDK